MSMTPAGACAQAFPIPNLPSRTAPALSPKRASHSTLPSRSLFTSSLVLPASLSRSPLPLATILHQPPLFLPPSSRPTRSESSTIAGRPQASSHAQPAGPPPAPPADAPPLPGRGLQQRLTGGGSGVLRAGAAAGRPGAGGPHGGARRHGARPDEREDAAAARGELPALRALHLLRGVQGRLRARALLLLHQLQHPQPPLRVLLFHAQVLRLPRLQPLSRFARNQFVDRETESRVKWGMQGYIKFPT